MQLLEKKNNLITRAEDVLNTAKAEKRKSRKRKRNTKGTNNE